MPALWLILAVILAAVLVHVSSFGQTPHELFHYGVYDNWLTRDGGSCCNDNDCGGAAAWKFGADGYQVLIDGEWRLVPPEAIRPYASPDGNAHVCVWLGRILCFVPGSGA